MQKRIYGIISALLLIVSIAVLTVIDKTSNIKLSLTIQIILILYLSKIVWGCLIYIKNNTKKGSILIL